MFQKGHSGCYVGKTVERDTYARKKNSAQETMNVRVDGDLNLEKSVSRWVESTQITDIFQVIKPTYLLMESGV